MRTIIRNRAAGMALVFSTGSCSGWCFIWICHRITGCGGRFYYCSGSEAFNPFIHGIGYCHFFMCYFTDRRDCCSGGQAEWYARVRYNCRGIPRRCMSRFTGRPVGVQRLPGNSVSHIFGGLLVIVALSMLISTMR